MQVVKPSNEVLQKCAQVCQIICAKDVELHDWIKCVDNLGTGEVISVEEKNPKLDYPKKRRLFFGFCEKRFSIEDQIENNTSYEKLLSNYIKTGSHGTFQDGFREHTNSCLQKVLNKLSEINNEIEDEVELEDYEIILCGHSFGGAVAAVTYIKMETQRLIMRRRKKPPIVSQTMAIEKNAGDHKVEIKNAKVLVALPRSFYCVTFGAPTFGDENNRKFLNDNKISLGIYNVIHEKDPIFGIFFNIPKNMQPMFTMRPTAAIGTFEILCLSTLRNYIVEACKGEHLVERKLCNLEASNAEASNTIDLKYHKLESYISYIASDNRKSNTETDQVDRINKYFTKEKKSYRALQYIGGGSYGHVLRGKNTDTDQDIAIKKIKKDIKGHKKEFVEEDNDGNEISDNNEVKNLLRLGHENVIDLIDHFVISEKQFLIFEFCPFGSLHAFIIKSKQEPLKQNEIKLLLRQTLTGVSFMHGRKIIHRDIKPENILVSNSFENPVYKLGDLGSSRVYEGKTKTMTVAGTKIYMSPEIFLGYLKDKGKIRFNAQTDVFSLGAVVLFCLRGKEPWTEDELYKFASCKDGKDIVYNILQEHAFKQRIGLSDLDKIKIMLVEMTKVDRKERPTAQYLLKHPFMTEEPTENTEITGHMYHEAAESDTIN